MRKAGFHHSEETKRKIVHSNLRENRAGGNSGCLGYKHTEEARKKISQSKMGNKAFGGQRHTESARLKISQAHMGDKNPMWNGGRTKMPKGYIRAKARNHPHADINGYVLEHRLIAERIIGRILKPEEIVHHLNGKKDDNRPTNLILCPDEKCHRSLHRQSRSFFEEQK